MSNSFISICYNIIFKHKDISEVANTLKDIQDGYNYMNRFSDTNSFLQSRSEIIGYIMKVRTGNIIDAVKENNPYTIIPDSFGKTLFQCTPEELYNNLSVEVERQILKGAYQVITHFNNVDTTTLVQKLTNKDETIFQEYNLN